MTGLMLAAAIGVFTLASCGDDCSECTSRTIVELDGTEISNDVTTTNELCGDDRTAFEAASTEDTVDVLGIVTTTRVVNTCD